jgi:DNA repair protein RadA/Sms
MPKSRDIFICQNCGAASPKWQGQCPGCGEWNTLLAEVASANSRKPARAAQASRAADTSTPLAAEALLEQARLATGSTELDRVLGGGLVPGSVTLIGGDPGIGKSTLMLQAAAALQAAGPVLYATGEESLKQVALRARRLGLEAATARLIAETCVEDIVGAARGVGARVLIVDSIQTMYSQRIEAAPGAVSQLRECTAELVRFGSLLGVAFQIHDDVLNLRGVERRYGKETAGDLWEGKRTLILAHALSHIGAADRTWVGCLSPASAAVARSPILPRFFCRATPSLCQAASSP